jgi:hypothetical protein
MRGLVLAAVLGLGLPACASLPSSLPMDPSFGPMPAAAEDAKDEGGPGVFSIGHTILMYIPNRILDAFDMVRAGVNVGPGVGAQLKATDAAQVEFMSRLSAGVGLQSLRHLPAYAGAESGVGIGPAEAGGTMGIGWFQSPTDIRIELHPAIVGAHAAVDPVEIVDFILGFFTIDLRDDDY